MQPLEENPSSAVSPSQDKSKNSCGPSKLSCAFSALKCNSRAKVEDNLPLSFQSDNSSIDDSILEPDAYFDTETPTKLNGTPRQEGHIQAFVHTAKDPSGIVPFHPEEKPRRIPSEDTNDTPNTCNRDPSRLTKGDLTNSNSDAYYQTYFNTPRGIVTSHTTLGDCITPLGSPVRDSEGDDEHDKGEEPRSVSQDRCVPSILQMPPMQPKLSSTRRAIPHTRSDLSSRSVLLGEYIAEEKKMTDEDSAGSRGLTLDPYQASVKIGQQEVRAAINYPSAPLPDNRAAGGNPAKKRSSYVSLSVTNASSFSSVSTFEAVSSFEALSQKSHIRRSRPKLPIRRQKRLTPHPFFWRSHPKVTNRSYDVQYSSNLMQSMTPQISTTLRTVDSEEFSCLSEDSPQRPLVQERRNTSSLKDCGEPYLNPSVVRKMWMESKPIDMHINTEWRAKKNSSRHPQGPPSARSGALIQSLTAFAATSLPSVFTRSENT